MSTVSSDSESDDMALPRLIALFPGVDIGLLSTALDRGEGDFDQAAAIVRETVGTPSETTKKARPSGSARRRERKLSNDGAIRRQEDDEELSRQLKDEEDRLFTDKIQKDYSMSENRPGTSNISRNRLHNSDTALNESPKTSMNQLASRELFANNKDDVIKSHDNLHAGFHSDDKSISRSKRLDNLIHGETFHDPAHVIEIMTRDAITEAASKSQLSSHAMSKNAALLSTGIKPSMNINDASSTRSHSVNTNLRDDESDDDEDSQQEDYDDEEGGDVYADNGGNGHKSEESLQKQIQELFSYTKEYQPEAIELFPELKCFIPDYIPAIGDIDPMIKIPTPPQLPKGQKSAEPVPDAGSLGLTVLDEPATKQSEPAVLDLQLRAASKGGNSVANQQVRSINLNFSNAPSSQAGQKALVQWVQNVHDLHVHKPPDRVEYSKRMPDIEKLMEEWPPSIDVSLSTNSIKLPTSDIDLNLADFTKLICTILDIPVNMPTPQHLSASKKVGDMSSKSHSHIESLHVLFTLYSEFKNSQHFGRTGFELI